MSDIPIKKLSEYKWEIPKGAVPGMRVPGIIYADDRLMKDIARDRSARQVANGATLPGIVGASMAMPDMHFGYGLPIGGVVATDIDQDGIISPGGTGYDINCGVRMAVTRLTRKDLDQRDRLQKLVDTLFTRIPTGVGSKGPIKLTRKEQEKVLTRGARWAVEKGLGIPEDLVYTESEGCMEGADPSAVTDRALTRGTPQQGTLGSGNHFIEVQFVDEIFDPFGISKGQIAVMVHSGSRGFGHQVCTDSLEVMTRAVRKYGIVLPDQQLACAPFNSPEGLDYWKAMKCAANYAWANRQCLMHWVREALEDFLQIGPSDLGFSLVYDIAHNIVKLEKHEVDGKTRTLAVHRKGATRAFPPGHREIPERYRPFGQPVIIPGDMTRASSPDQREGPPSWRRCPKPTRTYPRWWRWSIRRESRRK